MTQCKCNPPLLCTVVSGCITPILSYRTLFRGLEMFVRFWKTAIWPFFLAQTVQCKGCHRCKLGTVCEAPKEGNMPFFSSASAFYLLCNVKGFGLVPGTILPCSSEGAPAGSRRMGSPSHSLLVQTGPFKSPGGRKVKRNQAALWLNPFHPETLFQAEWLQLRSWEKAGESKETTATSCRRAQQVDNPLSSREDSPCLSSPGADLGWAARLVLERRRRTMVAGRRCGNKVQGSSAMAGESNAEPKSASLFHGTSVLWNKTVQWMAK